MKIALIQMNSVSDKVANITEASRLIDQAVASEKPDWVLLPEHFNWAGGGTKDKIAHADQVPGGEAYEAIRQLAIRHRIWIHAGSLLEAIPGEERVYNTTCVFNRDGKEVARYRKIHLFDIVTPDGVEYRESATIRGGRDIVTYDCEGFRIGCTICYDLRFAELFQALVDAGANVIAVPSSFTVQTGKDHWDVLLRARAIETQAYVLAAGQCGFFTSARGDKRLTYGHSLAADPWGHVIAKASDGPGIVTARLDKAMIERVRRDMPVDQHRIIGREAMKSRLIAAE
ncbi:MAG: carbon-nitrogen hydrolase family protein [Hyphomicrobiales bacterium]|nr:carbon-nitrogen hydrolase family protein [Hyphomicrobiales bacterium]OQW80835.1 MAG: carbon-nitrogen hydrolase [Proteobacteria bacterium ST_bin15]